MAQPTPLNTTKIVVAGGVLNSNPSVAVVESAQASGYTTHVGTFSTDFTFAYCPSPFAPGQTLRYFTNQTVIADLALYAALNNASAPVTWAD